MFKQLLDARYVSSRQRESERRELMKVLGRPGLDDRQGERFECAVADTATSLPFELTQLRHHHA